jgi:hypothetical protein
MPAIGNHHLIRCKQCTSIVTQCRCPSEHKVEGWTDQCLDCARLEREEVAKIKAGQRHDPFRSGRTLYVTRDYYEHAGANVDTSNWVTVE